MLTLTRILQSSSVTARAALPFRLQTKSRVNRCFAERAGLNVKLFSAQDCPLCDGLKDKLEALRQRSQFQQDFWTGLSIEVIDVDEDEALREKYRMKVPVLAYERDGQWTELPFQSPRLHADALGKRLEKIITEDA